MIRGVIIPIKGGHHPLRVQNLPMGGYSPSLREVVPTNMTIKIIMKAIMIFFEQQVHLRFVQGSGRRFETGRARGSCSIVVIIIIIIIIVIIIIIIDTKLIDMLLLLLLLSNAISSYYILFLSPLTHVRSTIYCILQCFFATCRRHCVSNLCGWHPCGVQKY